MILARDTGSGFEILMLRRTAHAAFAGGMYVFPGGRVDGDDHLHVYDAIRRGPDDCAGAATARRSVPNGAASGSPVFAKASKRRACCSPTIATARCSICTTMRFGSRFDDYRHALHDGELSLDEICTREGLTLAIDRMHFLNRWITPEGRPRRFDTRFFIAEAPAKQHGRHDEYETVDSVWISPADALTRNDRGEFGLMSVTRRQLEILADFGRCRRCTI